MKARDHIFVPAVGVTFVETTLRPRDYIRVRLGDGSNSEDAHYVIKNTVTGQLLWKWHRRGDVAPLIMPRDTLTILGKWSTIENLLEHRAAVWAPSRTAARGMLPVAYADWYKLFEAAMRAPRKKLTQIE